MSTGLTQQSLKHGLLAFVLAIALAPTFAPAQTEAYVGEPFGVGSVTIALPAGAANLTKATDGYFISERDGRVLYPAFTAGAARRILGELFGVRSADSSGRLTILFLFTGDEPLDVTVNAPAGQRFTVTPTRTANPRRYDLLLLRWWREYNGQARQQADQGDYPPLVQTYLTSMLSRRLGLEPPLLSRLNAQSNDDSYDTLKLLAGVESLRMETLRQSSLGRGATAQSIEFALPSEIPWQRSAVATVDANVDIEPMATRVPEECFYVRFGTFENYLWLDHLQKDYGGDISRMVTLRGFDQALGQRVQQQLALRSSAMAEVLGPTVIKDVALIGRDLYLREGPAIGMLFQARNALLGGDFLRQRKAALNEFAASGATDEAVQIAGRDVSFLSTPDNRLHSYYVADGDFHLVTTCRAIVERFIAVGEQNGTGSLGQSPMFHHARTMIPTSREDTIFVYFSPQFFQGLLSPQYQIELARRLRAVTDLELLDMATWAARHEGVPADNVEDLIRGGLLPADFGQRADGSHPVLVNGRLVDSLRGPRGSFVPVPDVEIRGITRDEATRLAKQAAFHAQSWPSMDPLIVGLKRYALDDQGRERIVMDAHVSPFVQDKYGWVTSVLGPPTDVRIRPAENDVITAQAVVTGGPLAGAIATHHLFLGIQDHHPLSEMRPQGLFEYLTLLRTTPGYLGGWPKPGFLDMLPLQLGGGPPDAAGYSRLLLGIWRRQWDAFSVLSFDPEILARVTPQLIPEQSEGGAQLRVHVGDLSQARLEQWIDGLAYSRALQASLGNAKLLHAMTQQLGVPRNQTLPAAESLLDAQLVCSLGGQYQMNELTGQWTSTSWSNGGLSDFPAEYSAPLLEWFRGLDAELTMYEDRVVLHTELDMQRKPEQKPSLPLPLFNLFGGNKQTPKPSPKTKPPAELEEVPVLPPPPEPE